MPTYQMIDIVISEDLAASIIRRLTVRTSTSQLLFMYIYIYINIFLFVSNSAEIVFTTNIGANCYRGFVTTDNIGRNRAAATRGATHSITESHLFWWRRNWKIMRSNLLSYQSLWRLHSNLHQNSNWFCVGLIIGEKEMKVERHVTFFNFKKYFYPISVPSDKAT